MGGSKRPKKFVGQHQRRGHARYDARQYPTEFIAAHAQYVHKEGGCCQRQRHNEQLTSFETQIEGQKWCENSRLLPQQTAQVVRKTQPVNEPKSQRQAVAQPPTWCGGRGKWISEIEKTSNYNGDGNEQFYDIAPKVNDAQR